MSRSITVRDVPNEVADKLHARAQASGRSLQEYLQRVLAKEVSKPEMSVWLEEVRAARTREQEAGEPGLTVDDILEARDADRM